MKITDYCNQLKSINQINQSEINFLSWRFSCNKIFFWKINCFGFAVFFSQTFLKFSKITDFFFLMFLSFPNKPKTMCPKLWTFDLWLSATASPRTFHYSLKEVFLRAVKIKWIKFLMALSLMSRISVSKANKVESTWKQTKLRRLTKASPSKKKQKKNIFLVILGIFFVFFFNQDYFLLS